MKIRRNISTFLVVSLCYGLIFFPLILVALKPDVNNKSIVLLLISFTPLLIFLWLSRVKLIIGKNKLTATNVFGCYKKEIDYINIKHVKSIDKKSNLSSVSIYPSLFRSLLNNTNIGRKRKLIIKSDKGKLKINGIYFNKDDFDSLKSYLIKKSKS